MGSDALLLGRVTYEGFADAWPQRDGEFADKFNNMPKYVVSLDAEGPGVDQLDGARRRPDRARSRESRSEHDGDIVVHGSVQLAQALLENDLVDELRLMVFPVVLGSGKRLWGETSDKKTPEARRLEGRGRRRRRGHGVRPLAGEHAAGEVDDGARVDVVTALVLLGRVVIDHRQHQLLAR